MESKESKSVLKSAKEVISNTLLGDQNILLQGGVNHVHVGDITYNTETKKRSIRCLNPKCKAQASEEDKKEREGYCAFKCKKCGEFFYEMDEVAKNISQYVNLDSTEGKQLKRLVEAVTHDMEAEELESAYQRCQREKQTYGLTPEIYQWGAYTLFLCKSMDYWLKTSLKRVIVYLDQSKKLDKDGGSKSSHDKIASSIATRYFQEIMYRIERAKKGKPIVTLQGKKTEYERNINWTKQQVFSLLMEVEYCYKAYPNADFLKIALLELYGYREISWYKRRFICFCIEPQSDKTGKVRLLKGYIMDYHKLKGNAEEMFEGYKYTPAKFAVKLEDTLLEIDTNQEFSIINVDPWITSLPISSRLALRIFGFLVIMILVFLSILSWYLGCDENLIGILWTSVVAIFLFVYMIFGIRSDVDDKRRVKNDYKGRF